MNKSPCSSCCVLAAMQRGRRHRLHKRYCCLSFCLLGLYPGGHALGCGPGGTLPSVQVDPVTSESQSRRRVNDRRACPAAAGSHGHMPGVPPAGLVTVRRHSGTGTGRRHPLVSLSCHESQSIAGASARCRQSRSPWHRHRR